MSAYIRRSRDIQRDEYFKTRRMLMQASDPKDPCETKHCTYCDTDAILIKVQVADILQPTTKSEPLRLGTTCCCGRVTF